MSNEPHQISLTYSDDSKEISIDGITRESIVIKYDVDIDLTTLVVGLSKRMDSAVPIQLEYPPIDDNEKLSLIVDTIREIVDEYNACLDREEEEDLPEFEDEEPQF